ncbi:MAG: aminopeptidase P family protein [Candidatus Muirbacterium halophilum]|nr:aminopeptidase P family protein [Candidatus Muirbacterium halophilum]
MIKNYAYLLKENKIDAMLIMNPVNVFYITGVHADATYILLFKDSIKIITNFIYFEDIKSKKTIDAEVVMSTRKDFFEHFDTNINIGFECEFMTFAEYKRFIDKKVKLIPVSSFLEILREIKDDNELKCIKKAVNITDKAFSYVIENLHEGISETEIAEIIRRKHVEFGASKNSFETIAAIGENSSLPHAVCSDKRKLQKGQMLKLDFGCIADNYCSDMTRTVFFGKASHKFEKIYNIVLSAQLKAIEKIKPGAKAADIDKVARDYITKKGFGGFFGHGLGHGVGIEVHESPRLAAGSLSILKPGNVVTVEPGIYLPGWGGIRIEDDIVVTEDGCTILNKSLKKLIEID